MPLTDHVNPSIGIDGSGNCLIGPYLPFSLVRLGPDTLPPHPTNGYRSDRPIIRFSHTHVSGTGGAGRYGNIGVLPFTGPLRATPDATEREAETAAAGYYEATLVPSGIHAELTVTPRTGVHRYSFPDGAQANVLIDIAAVNQRLPSATDPNGFTPICTGGFVEFASPAEVIGRGDFHGGWGHGFAYSVYVYARFDRPSTARHVATANGLAGSVATDGPGCRAVATFGPAGRVELRVGISFVSVAKARASVERESAGQTFEHIRATADATWEQYLSRIVVEGGTSDQRTLFYTLFTRLVCMPSDLGVDDEFPFWHSGVRHFSEYYCLWDSVRNANSLIGLVDPDAEVGMLNCLLDVADHTGWLPDAWIAGHSAMIQGGSSADILLCEAALKELMGIDYSKALRQMRKNNEVESPDPYLYGRHLKDYRDLGFVSTQVRKNCVSRHLEYAYQDWCIGRLAAHLGQADVAADYTRSSRKLWDLWRDDIKAFAPRLPDGRWVASFDPDYALADSWNDPYFYEGTSRQWSFNTQHDFAGLVRRHGGDAAFARHLDDFFERPRGGYGSKETMLHIPYLYLYAGRPDRTADRVRWALRTFFSTRRNGLHDNEDMGCQSAFYMASSLGLYPLMGQDLYWLTTPVFERSTLTLGRADRMLTIEASGASDDRPYVASATLNGKPLDRAWLRHSEIAGGGTLRFERSATPTAWGRAIPPPSPLVDPA